MLKRLNRWRQGLLLGVSGVPKNGLGSIDVTSGCNLRCDHCYFFAGKVDHEWPIERWEQRFSKLKREGFPFLQCTFVGGEPLLRPELIELGRRYFRKCWVVTNGTIPLPDWPDVTFYVSVDGTEALCDALRGEGVYRRLVQNVAASRSRIRTATVLTSANHGCLEDLVREWRERPIDGMVFDFFTPVKGLQDELWPGFDERDRIIDRLQRLKDRYGDFIVTSGRVFDLMRSDRAGLVTSNCPFARKAFAFTPSGAVKEPCMLGPGADCDRCGCVVPFFLHHLESRGAWIEEGLRHARRALRRRFRATSL